MAMLERRHVGGLPGASANHSLLSTWGADPCLGPKGPWEIRMVAKSISHPEQTMVETLVGWYFWGRNSFQGFFGGAGFRPSTASSKISGCPQVLNILKILNILNRGPGN